MKTKTQIKIDHFIGYFIAIVINWVVRLLGILLRLDHSLSKPPRSIVVCKFKGMGSIIQSTPLLQTLRLNFKDANIVFVSSKANRALLKKIPDINDIIIIDDSSVINLAATTFRALLALWKLRVSVYLDLEIYSNFSSLITTLSLARNRAGYYRQASHYRKGIYTHMMYYNIKAPISKVYLQFAHLLHCGQIVETLFPLPLLQSAYLSEAINTGSGKYIVINANASDLRIERRWPKERFVELIQNIMAHHPEYKLVLVGSVAEREYVGSISRHFAGNQYVIDITGKTSLDGLLQIIKNAEIIITNDTGPMHLAFSLGVKTLALFGPCSPAQYGENENGFAVYNNVYCSPCIHEFDVPPCKGNNQCMKTITADQVCEVLTRALQQPSSPIQTGHPIRYSGLNNEVLGMTSR